MKFGLFFPQFEELAEPARVAELAVMAEEAGWSGFFLWDHMLARPGMAICDPWITMAPNLMSRVAVATAAIAIHGSQTAMPGLASMWSQRKNPDQPASSAMTANSATRAGSASTSNWGKKSPNLTVLPFASGAL